MDVADQAEDGRVQIIDDGLEVFLLPFAAFQHEFVVFTRRRRLKGRHDAQPQVNQVVLAAMELMDDEGGGVNVPVVVLAPLDLKHLGPEYAARMVADAGGAKLKRRENAVKPVMQRGQRLEIGDGLLDPCRSCRLRELLEKGQAVTVLVLRRREEVVKKRAGVIGELRIHECNKFRLSGMQSGTDLFEKHARLRDLYPALDEEVDATVENQGRLQVRTRHCCDLCRHGGSRCRIKVTETVKFQYAPLMPQPRRLGVFVRIEHPALEIELVCDKHDATLMKVVKKEEPLCRLEVPTEKQETDLAGGSAQPSSRRHQRLGQDEEPLSLHMVKSGRRIKRLLLA